MSIRRTLDPITILEEEARAMAKCFGNVASDDVAAALVDRILGRLGGMHVYFPLVQSRQREARRQIVKTAIKTRFDGKNLKELAHEYGISQRHVRRLLE